MAAIDLSDRSANKARILGGRKTGTNGRPHSFLGLDY
jgi:hypothetical protein